MGVQALGVSASAAFAFIVSYIILSIMKVVMNGLRVTEEEEIIGLDMSEHGSYGYPELVNSHSAQNSAIGNQHSLLNTQHRSVN